MNKQVWKNPVFIVSSLVILTLVVVGSAKPKAFGAVANRIFHL